MHAVALNLTITDPEAAGPALKEQLAPRVSQAPGFVTGDVTALTPTPQMNAALGFALGCASKVTW